MEPAPKHLGHNSPLKEIFTHFHYLDEFIGELDCAPQLLKHKLMPNAKEVTECLAVLNAVRKHLKSFDMKDPNVAFVSVGATPRISALFSFLTKWKCYSVDPLLPTENKWQDIQRLEIVSGKIENFQLKAAKMVAVFMHAHIPVQAALTGFNYEQLGIVASPCCNFYESCSIEGVQPLVTYEDTGMLTPHRTIKVFQLGSAPSQPQAVVSRYIYAADEVRRDLCQKYNISPETAAYLVRKNALPVFDSLLKAGLDVTDATFWTRGVVRFCSAHGKPITEVDLEKAEKIVKSDWTNYRKKSELSDLISGQKKEITSEEEELFKRSADDVVKDIMKKEEVKNITSETLTLKSLRFIMGLAMTETKGRIPPAAIRAAFISYFGVDELKLKK